MWHRVRAAAGWPERGPDASPVSSGAAVGTRDSGSFASAACGRDVSWRLALPPGAAAGEALPVALVLHGRGGSARSAFSGLALDGFLADAVASGTPPFTLASVDGGDHSYWHRRATGEDPQGMLVQEYLPLLADRGLVTSRIAAFGWSMGGYGALLLVTALGPDRVAAVAADSPALWERAADTAPGAFDDAADFAADFAAHDVSTRQGDLADIRVRVACGESDPFYDATRAFAATTPDLAGAVYGPGAHDQGYWRSTALGQLRFLGSALASR